MLESNNIPNKSTENHSRVLQEIEDDAIIFEDSEDPINFVKLHYLGVFKPVDSK